MRRRLVALLLASQLASGSAAAAALPIPGFPDPVEIALLAKIVRELEKAYGVLKSVNKFVRDFRDLTQVMYPKESLNQLKMLFRNVNSLMDEIEKMSCGWRFAPRVEPLRLGLLRKGPLCRTEYQRVVGAPLPGPDADLVELRQWNAVRRLNTVASTIEASRAWTTAANSYGGLTRAGGTSPGRALRYTAALSALNLMQEVRGNTHEAELLSAAQEELDMEMREDFRRQNYADELTRWTIASKDVLAGQSLARDLMGVGR